MLKNEIYHISLVFSKLTLVIVSEISVIVVHTLLNMYPLDAFAARSRFRSFRVTLSHQLANNQVLLQKAVFPRL